MAKKSNKTEHVLKLITKNDGGSGDNGLFDLDQEISSNGTLAVKNAVHARPQKEEIEIEPEIEIKLEAVKQTAETSVKEPVQVPAAEIPAEPPAAAAPVQVPAAEIPVEPPAAAAPVQVPAAEIPVEPPVILERNEDLVNIAEILAREKLSLVMERMKVCTCKTCANDVLALALNSLPTKYVTTDAGKQYFQLDVYKKQYETDILAALTKACVRVKAVPRH